MRSAQKINIFSAVVTATPKRLEVVELEPIAVSATPAAFVNECALPSVPRPNGTPDRGWDVTRISRRIRLFEALSGGLRPAKPLRFQPFGLLGHRLLY